MQIKRWESPRYEGRNHKGKKKSARQRQIKKQTQVWIQKLKGDGDSKGKNDKGSGPGSQNSQKRSGIAPLLFLWRFLSGLRVSAPLNAQLSLAAQIIVGRSNYRWLSGAVVYCGTHSQR